MAQAAKARVHISNEAFFKLTADTFRKSNFANDRYEIVLRPEDANIVVWTGGEDICPAIYGEKAIPHTSFYTRRDERDLDLLDKALKQGQFLVGICRGAQLLNCVPNEGKLYQDVDGHQGSHKTFDCITGDWIDTNSVHHQMMRPTSKAQVLAWAQESTFKKAEREVWSAPPEGSLFTEKDRDIEALWYPDTRSLCVQFHPEFGHAGTTKYFFELMDKFYWLEDGRPQIVGYH